MIAIDRNSLLPLYHQLQQILLGKIEAGHIAPGDMLPSEKELEEQYNVSRITVRRALSELAAAGYVDRQPGRGTFVLQRKVEHRSGQPGGFREDLAMQGFQVKSEIIEHELRPAPQSVACRIGADEDRPLLYFKRLVYADGDPIGITSGYHNLGAGIRFTREELASDSIFRLVERKYGIALRGVDRTIEATLPSEEEMELLHVTSEVPVLLMELLVYGAGGQVVSVMRNVYRGDRYKYQIRSDAENVGSVGSAIHSIKAVK